MEPDYKADHLYSGLIKSNLLQVTLCQTAPDSPQTERDGSRIQYGWLNMTTTVLPREKWQRRRRKCTTYFLLKINLSQLHYLFLLLIYIDLIVIGFVSSQKTVFLNIEKTMKIYDEVIQLFLLCVCVCARNMCYSHNTNRYSWACHTSCCHTHMNK